MKRVFTILVLIILGFIAQSTVFKAISFGGIVPNIMLMITSCFGFMRGKTEGMYVGFFTGFTVDVFYGGGILGLYAFLYMLIGYTNGFFHRIFYPEDVKLPIFFIAVSDGLYCCLCYVFLFLLRTKMNFLSYLRYIILPEVIYTVLITLIFYRVILKINTRLEAGEKKKEAKFV